MGGLPNGIQEKDIQNGGCGSRCGPDAPAPDNAPDGSGPGCGPDRHPLSRQVAVGAPGTDGGLLSDDLFFRRLHRQSGGHDHGHWGHRLLPGPLPRGAGQAFPAPAGGGGLGDPQRRIYPLCRRRQLCPEGVFEAAHRFFRSAADFGLVPKGREQRPGGGLRSGGRDRSGQPCQHRYAFHPLAQRAAGGLFGAVYRGLHRHQR